MIWKKAENIYSRLSEAKHAAQDYANIRRAHKRYMEKRHEYQLAAQWDFGELISTLACEVLGRIEDALRPHKEALQNLKLHDQSRFDQPSGINEKHLEKSIKEIEAVTMSNIVDALNPDIKILEKP